MADTSTVIIGAKRLERDERRQRMQAVSSRIRAALYDVDMSTIELQQAVAYLIDVVDELAERLDAQDAIRD